MFVYRAQNEAAGERTGGLGGRRDGRGKDLFGRVRGTRGRDAEHLLGVAGPQGLGDCREGEPVGREVEHGGGVPGAGAHRVGGELDAERRDAGELVGARPEALQRAGDLGVLQNRLGEGVGRLLQVAERDLVHPGGRDVDRGEDGLIEPCERETDPEHAALRERAARGHRVGDAGDLDRPVALEHRERLGEALRHRARRGQERQHAHDALELGGRDGEQLEGHAVDDAVDLDVVGVGRHGREALLLRGAHLDGEPDDAGQILDPGDLRGEVGDLVLRARKVGHREGAGQRGGDEEAVLAREGDQLLEAGALQELFGNGKLPPVRRQRVVDAVHAARHALSRPRGQGGKQ